MPSQTKNGQLGLVSRFNTSVAEHLARPFPEGRGGMMNPLIPSGLAFQKPALPNQRFEIRRIEEVPLSGDTAVPRGKIQFTAVLSNDAIIMPCMHLSYTLRNSASGTGGMCQGSWAPFKVTRTYINGEAIEYLEDFNVFHSYEVGINRTDVAPSGTGDTYDPFTPQIREYAPLRIVGNSNKAVSSSSPQGLIFELSNPITRTGQPFPANWFGAQMRFELELAPIDDIRWPTSGAGTPNFTFENLRFVYYTIQMYDDTTKRQFQNTGFVLPMHYVTNQPENWGTTGDYNRQINESTGCLNALVMIPLRTTKSSAGRSKLTRYITGTENHYQSLQMFVEGKNLPQQVLTFNAEDEGRGWEYCTRWGHIGPQKRLDMYQGGMTGPRSFGPIFFPFGPNTFQKEEISDGLNLKSGNNDIKIQLKRTSGSTGVATILHVFILSTGVLAMDYGKGVSWSR